LRFRLERRPLDLVNGYANRFLWCLAEGRGRVAIPDEVSEEEKALARDVKAALDWGRRLEEPLVLADDARDLWDKIHKSEIDADRPAFVERGLPMMLRIAGIYCTQARSCTISQGHLLAAQEVWRVCRESALCLF